ncbi:MULTISPECIES: hypothetical protein [Pontibacillus]|uniref:Uncharacterized protein n=1 Tax=Pontibacillus chungwhensis TaxID=265426 RepID=A0ABY8V5L9_9BACI|nr:MULTISPECIES: hypothetical protein [Pontibacillus]MCD5326135.1 hypothetical protein [Pontibacillus sp. HN14]WIG00307.1 hypothetical protein QNI29_20890 [Pontibacillus chungwhensis]
MMVLLMVGFVLLIGVGFFGIAGWVNLVVAIKDVRDEEDKRVYEEYIGRKKLKEEKRLESEKSSRMGFK